MAQKINIALVEDESLFRKGVSSLLNHEKGMKVIFEAENGAELLNFLEQNDDHPNIVLMDLNTPKVNGIQATRIIARKFPQIKIIVLTSHKTRSLILNTIQIGAASYLLKNTSAQKLISTIREVAEKGCFYDEEVLDILKENSEGIKKQRKLVFDCDELTPREKEVLKLICKQYNTKEIADKLFISNRTVDGHRNNLLMKTDSKNMAGLVVFALLNEIITTADLI